MIVTIENSLDVFVHVLVLRLSPASADIVISSEKHLPIAGETLLQECLQPGTALELRNFDDSAQLAAVTKGFDGYVISSAMREWNDPQRGRCATLSLLRRKPTGAPPPLPN